MTDKPESMGVEESIEELSDACFMLHGATVLGDCRLAGVANLIRSLDERARKAEAERDEQQQRHEKGEKWADQIIDDQAEEIKEMDLKIDELKAQLAQKDNEIAELKNRVRKQEMLNADLILDAKEIQLAHEICRDKL